MRLENALVYNLKQNGDTIKLYYILGDWNNKNIRPSLLFTLCEDSPFEEFQNQIKMKSISPDNFIISSGPVYHLPHHWSFTFVGAQLRKLSDNSDHNKIEIQKEPDGLYLVKIFSTDLGEVEIDCLRFIHADK